MIDTEILQDYITEARELLEEMDDNLLRLEQEGATPDLLNNIFRAVHCIKGSAQYIGLEKSSALSHSLENLLDRLREGVIRMDLRVSEALFRAKDLMANLVDEVSKDQQEHSEILQLMAELDALLSGGAPTVELKEEAAQVGTSSATEEELQGAVTAPDVLERENTYGTEQPLDALAEWTAPITADDQGSPIATPASSEESPEEHFLDPDLQALEEVEELPSALSGEVQELDASASDDVAEANGEQVPTEALREDLVGAIAQNVENAVNTEAYPERVSLEQTVSPLLSIALYLDDLQDGLRPGEIIDAIMEPVGIVKNSFKALGLPDAEAILRFLEQRLGSVNVTRDRLSWDEVDELRSILFQLKSYYPEDLFPLKESAITEGSADTSGQITTAPSTFSYELLAVPGVDDAIASAIERAGFSSKEDLAKASFGTLKSIPGVTPTIAEALLKSVGIVPTVTERRFPPRRPREISLLADVDDELLREFEQVFDESFAPAVTKSVESAARQGQRAADLLEELGSVRENGDREIVEIFLGFGEEVMNKLRPVVAKITQKKATRDDMMACADAVRSIRSSAGYMDYRKLESFLDQWYEHTLWAADVLQSLDEKDLVFMEESLDKFQDFLHGLQRALSPGAVPEMPVRASGPDFGPAPGLVETPSRVFPEPRTDGARPGTLDRPVTREVDAVSVQSIPGAAPTVTAPQRKTAVKQPFIADEPATENLPMAPPAGREITSEQRPFPEDAGAVRDMLLEQEVREKAVVSTMRVDSAKVDTLLNQVGELAVNRSYIERLAQDLKDFQRAMTSMRDVGKREVQSVKEIASRVAEASVALGRVANDIQEGVMKLRMLPVGQLFNRMPRLIRDLSRRVGKAVNLEIYGADTEVDKRVIEQIYNPMVHLIRNAVDHGIEDVKTREKYGKSENGMITLRAYSQGNQVIVDVEDDGAGIDTSAVVDRAVANGLTEAQEARNLTLPEIYNFLFMPGFSTSKTVTRTSGRGVGMDVVKKDVEKINGHVEVESWEHQGTRISIKIPLTLAIIQTLMIRIAEHVFAVPLTAVREIVRVEPGDISTIEGFEVIKFRDETIPVLRMNEVFKLRDYVPTSEPRFLVLAIAGSRSVGLLVEELLGEQDVVIKPLGEHVFKNRGLAGSSILGDGTIALVLDVLEIVEGLISEQRQLAARRPWSNQSNVRPAETYVPDV
jgi:two-component system, chemotaxis family, sensor kinase CheA